MILDGCRQSSFSPLIHYVPALVCQECDSPIDALLALTVPLAEATNMVVASWYGAGVATSLLTFIDGGRPVLAVPIGKGRWAACHAFFGDFCVTPAAAMRQLGTLVKGTRHGYVIPMPALLHECLPARIAPRRAAPAAGD